MKWVKAFVYLVIVILVLQVIKTVLDKYSFYLATILMCVQFLLIAGFFLFFIFSKIISLFKVRGKKAGRIALIAVIAFFISLEFIFAYLLNQPKNIPSGWLWSFKYYYDRYDSRLIQFQENSSVYDSALFYTLKPGAKFNYEKREFNNAFTTNIKGIRDDEKSLVAPQVICLGDSYAMGWGAEQSETFSELLEKQTGLTVLNAAVSSYGTTREMLLLDRLDTDSLQYLIIQYCGNDKGENKSYIDNNYRLGVSSKERYDSLVSASRLVGSYFPGKYSLLISQTLLKRTINKIVPVFKLTASREEPFINEKEHANAFVKVLDHSAIDFQKVKVIVLVLDRYLVLHNNFLHEVEQLAVQSPYKERFEGNLQLLDLSKVLTEQDYFKLDLHINASGHLKVAQRISDLIRKD